MFEVFVENFQNLERSMSYAFSIVYVCKLGVQNRCAPGPETESIVASKVVFMTLSGSERNSM
jgi:hypothetical protein